MKRVLQGAGIVALLAFAWAVCVVALSVRSVAKSVKQIDNSIYTVSRSTSDILLQVRQAIDAQKGLADEHAAYWKTVRDRTDKVLGNANQTVLDLDKMVNKTNANVNENLLPEATIALKTTNTALENTASSITTLSTDSHRTLTASGETMESLAKLVADPNIPQTLATANASMREWNETMHNVQETSKEARAWAHKAMTPVSLARRAVVFTWNSMLQFLGAYARAGT